MKSILTVGVISGVVLYFFFRNYSRKLGLGQPVSNTDMARNETEGYLYHQSDQSMING